MKKIKFFTLLVLSGALLLPACNSTANSIINDLSSQAGQSSDSQGGGNNSSQSTPAPSSSNNGGGQSSNSSSNPSRPSSSSQPGSSSTSQPSSSSSSQGGSTQTRYEITADEWKGLFTDLGLFGPNNNVTLNQAIRMGTIIMESGVLENNNGDLHILNDSTGEEPFELYADRLTDGSYEMYSLDDNGKWEKFAMPETYRSLLNASFSQYIPPMEYSTFTYNASDHAYWSAGGTVNMGEGQTMTVSNVCATFEDGKFMSLSYEISQGAMTANASVLASKYGSTFFDFPEVGSQGEIPDDNLFVNSLLRYKELKGCQLYSDKITKGQVEGLLSTSEILLFEDGEFEMYYKDAAGLRNVILGSYTVIKSSALLTTRSLYSDKSRTYSFEIPVLYDEFSLYYNEQNNDYEIGIYLASDEGDLLAKADLAFTKTSEQPIHLDLPQEPVNDKWSVNGDVWNKYFGGNFINRQTNITINHGDNLLEFDAGKVHSVVSMAQYGGAGTSEIYIKLLNDDLNKVDYYEYDKSAQAWTVRQNVDYEFAIIMAGDLGIKEYDFASATYNSVGHYYSIKKFVEYPYGPEAEYYEAFQDIKIYFENGQLQKISYKNAYNAEEVFLYSKAGSTSVKLPEVGDAPILEEMFVQKGYKYNSYKSSNSAFDIASYAGSMAMDEVRFFHDTTDYTFEFLMADREYDGSKGNQFVFTGKYSVKKASSTLQPYQYYLSLNVVNVYCNGMNLSEETDYALFEGFNLYYFEKTSELCLRDDTVPFQAADGSTDFTNLELYYKVQADPVSHFPLPRLEDNWSQYDVIIAGSQIGIMNDDLPKLDYVKDFSVSRPDTTNKTFDITCQMPNQFFIDHVFKPYKAALVSQYKFRPQYDNNNQIVSYVSPKAEFILSFEEQENFVIVFHIQNYTASVPEPEYPSSTIAEYLRANNVTDAVPEFKVQGATAYSAYGDSEYMSISIALDAGLIDNAVTSLIKLLTEAEYTTTNVGEMVVYNSKNNQVSVMISSSKEAGYLFVMLMKPISSSLESAYPSDKLASYLTGVTDTVPNYDHADGYQYATFGPNDDYLSFNIAVYLKSDSTVDVKALVEGFESDLVENNNYELYYVFSETLDMYPELCYVSPNKQVAIFFEYSVADKAYSVGFYNLGTIEGVQLLKEDTPTALTVANYKTEFEIVDEFTLGDDAFAYVYLMNGQTIEITADQLEYKPMTFTDSGDYEIEVSYTSGETTVTDIVYVTVNLPEPEYDNITLIVTNMNVFEDLINQEIDYSAYVIAKSEAEPDGEWCEVLIDVENNCVVVYDVNSAASEMTFFVEDENGTVLYYASLRMVAGQTEYTVTLVAANGN